MHAQPAYDNVKSLLEKMISLAKDPEKAQQYSDQIEVLSRAYMTPSMDARWEQYRMSQAEQRIARLLYSKYGEIVRKDSLLDVLYFDRDDEPGSKIIDVYICKMRKRLKNSPYAIETIWGVGHRMVANDGKQKPVVGYSGGRPPKKIVA